MTKPLLALALLVVAVPCLGQTGDDLINPDRPGIADGSSTLGRGRFQIEIGGERDDQPGQRVLTTPTLLRYGLTNAFELRIETNGYNHPLGSGAGSGLAPLSIGAKLHVFDRPSLGVIGRLFVPSGSGDFRSNRATGDLRLAADMNLNERWSLNPNVGFAFQSDDRRFMAALAALTVQYNFSKTVNGFVDGGLQTPETRGGTSSLLLDVGGAWVIGRDLQLDASVGWGAHGTTVPTVFWSAGVSRRF
jgi:hypothetical protein